MLLHPPLLAHLPGAFTIPHPGLAADLCSMLFSLQLITHLGSAKDQTISYQKNILLVRGGLLSVLLLSCIVKHRNQFRKP